MRGIGSLRSHLYSALKSLTLGADDQSFLGARWVSALLRCCPMRTKRGVALSVLSWSPHYFYRHSEDSHHGLNHREFTEREFERNRSTRERLGRLVLAPHLERSQVVLDYGCGPGFLVHYVAGLVKKVYGVDISNGVLECARVLNGSSNASFLHPSKMATIGDATLDLAYSFAVAQHITDTLLAGTFEVLRRKLKPEGKLVVHVVLEAEGWRSEEAWRVDRSIAGRLKLKYGLNCFARSEDGLRRMLTAAGFGSIVIRPMSELCPDPFDDVCTQHLVCATA